MQAIMETAFDVIYLSAAIALGSIILIKAKGRAQYLLFGIMVIVLGAGDAFHLVPRMIALNTTGTEDYAAALGIGMLITSITMTVFYVLLYHIWQLRYKKRNLPLTVGVYVLALVRIALCAFPQNEWTNADAPLSWGIYRNIPFLMLGIALIILFFIETRANKDKPFRFMWLAIALSFAFYIPVVLFADTVPLIGMLMIPKTLCYVWIVLMGLTEARKPHTETSKV